MHATLDGRSFQVDRINYVHEHQWLSIRVEVILYQKQVRYQIINEGRIGKQNMMSPTSVRGSVDSFLSHDSAS